jgi:hypothetical protein
MYIYVFILYFHANNKTIFPVIIFKQNNENIIIFMIYKFLENLIIEKCKDKKDIYGED